MTFDVDSPQCPKCGTPVLEGDVDLGTRHYYCRSCSETWPIPQPQSFDRPTPINPIAPVSARGLSASGGTPVAVMPGVTQGSPFGAQVWKESWDGVGWNVVMRRISQVLIFLFVVLVLAISIWVYGQRELFGDSAMVGLGVGLVLAFIGVLKMSRWTYIRLDPKNFFIDHRPNGRSMTVATGIIERFIILEEGPRKQQHIYSVHFLPQEGNPMRVDADFHTRAEAEYVMHRFNEMLGQVRGDSARPVQTTY